MTAAGSSSLDDLRATLSTAANLLQIQLGPRQVGELMAYVELLRRWNTVHNLSSTSDPSALMQHVIDCLAIVRPLAERLGHSGVRALDAGTGAGLPAVVLSVMFPDWEIQAVDAVGKKVAFVRQAAGELALRNLRPVHIRLEKAKREGAGNDVIVSRAFSALRQFVEQTQHLLAPDGWWAAMKGKLPESEIHSLPSNCELFHVEPLMVPGLDAERCLIWLRPKRVHDGAH